MKMGLTKKIYETINKMAPRDKVNVDIFYWGYGYSYEAWHGFWRPRDAQEGTRLLERYMWLPDSSIGDVMGIIHVYQHSAPHYLIEKLDEVLLHHYRRIGNYDRFGI